MYPVRLLSAQTVNQGRQPVVDPSKEHVTFLDVIQGHGTVMGSKYFWLDMKDSCRFTATSQAAWGRATVVFVPLFFCYDRAAASAGENAAKTGSLSVW